VAFRFKTNFSFPAKFLFSLIFVAPDELQLLTHTALVQVLFEEVNSYEKLVDSRLNSVGVAVCSTLQFSDLVLVVISIQLDRRLL
jgi:hypothetical protein